MDGEIEEGEEVMVLDPGGGNVLTVEATGAMGQDTIDRQLDRDASQSTETADASDTEYSESNRKEREKEGEPDR
jgi:hypothetical protein